jgi:TPR repeat protein
MNGVQGWGRTRFAELKAAAEAGDESAQLELGMRYSFGQDGAPRDLAQAAKWNRRAADQGNPTAQANLAHSYEHGEGVSRDDREAVRWRFRAAEGGDVGSQVDLAERFSVGRGVPQNGAEAQSWYRRAIAWYQTRAEAGDAGAQAHLATYLLRGQGVAPDIGLAITWFQKSALSGYDCANDELEAIYLSSGWPKELLPDGLIWFTKAAEAGRPKSQYIVGLMHQRGDGCEQDNIVALKWFQRAADNQKIEPPFPPIPPPLLPEAQKAVEDLRGILAALPKGRSLAFGGVDDVCSAVSKGNAQRLAALLAGGAPVNGPPRGRSGRCPFLIATSTRFSKGEVGGIRQGYEPERHDYWCRAGNNLAILRLLADHGATLFPLTDDPDSSPIHAAARSDNAEAVRIILERHPEAANHLAPCSPLEVAAASGSFQAVKALLSCGRVDTRSTSPFEIALKAKFSRTAKELIDSIPEGFGILEQLGPDPLFEMLLWSVVDDHARAFQMLLDELKRFPQQPSSSDRRAWDLWWEKECVLRKCFDYACSPMPKMEMVKSLFLAAETLKINDVEVTGLGNWPRPPLLHAAEVGSYGLAEFCLRVGADPFVQRNRQTALDIAQSRGHHAVACLLRQSMEGNYFGKVRSAFRKFLA